MRSFAPLRLAAQLCFYGAVLCLFAPFRADWQLFALLPVLALGAALAAVRCRSSRIRLVLGLGTALALLPASNWPGLAAGGLAVVYTAIVLAGGRFVLELWEYRREALVLIVLCAVTALLSNLAGFRSPPSRGFAVACAGLALLALRALRMRRAGSPGWEAGNAGFFLLPLAGGAVLGAAVWAAVPVFQYVVRAFGAFLGGLAWLWNSFWTWLMGSVDTIGDDFFVEETTAAATDLTEETLEFGNAAPTGTHVKLPGIRIPWGVLLAVAAGLVLLILVIRLLRRGRQPAPERTQEDFVFEDAPEAPKHARGRRLRRRAPKTNRTRVRTLYQEYLVYLRGNGVPRRGSDTTADVTEAARKVLLETDELLRDLYRKARYSSVEISDEELRAAEERLRFLTDAANLRK